MVAGLGYLVQIAAPRITTAASLVAPGAESWQANEVSEAAALWLHTSAPRFELTVHLQDGGSLLVQREFRMLSVQHRRPDQALSQLLFTRFEPPRQITCERLPLGWSLRLGGEDLVHVTPPMSPVVAIDWVATPGAVALVRQGLGRRGGSPGEPVTPVWQDLAIALQQRLRPDAGSIAEQVQQQHAALTAIDQSSAVLSGRGRDHHWLPPAGRQVAALLPAVLRAPLGGEALRPADLPEWADAWLAMAGGNAIATSPPPLPPVLGVPGFLAWWQSVETVVMPRHRWTTIVATAAIRRAIHQQQQAMPGSESASVSSLVALVTNDHDRWLLIDLLQRLQIYPTTVTTPQPSPTDEPLRWLMRQPQQHQWGADQPNRLPITDDAALDALLHGAPSAQLWTRPGPALPPAEALACWLLARQKAGLPADWSLLPLLPSVVLPLELLMPPAEPAMSAPPTAETHVE